MLQQDIFGSAIWITKENEDFPVIRRTFKLPENTKVKKAMLFALGLGFFRLYLNKMEVTDRAFLPLSTDYEERPDYPRGEKLHGHRIYVPGFDVTTLLREDTENLLTVFFGGGWYSFWNRADAGHSNAYYDPDIRYGDPKAIYRLMVETFDGRILEYVSSEEDLITGGGVYDYSFTTHECRDLRVLPFEALKNTDYDERSFEKAVPAMPLVTEYLFTDCPVDRAVSMVPVTPVSGETAENQAVYDCGRNLSGYPVLRVKAGEGEKVTVLFSEALHEDGSLDMYRNHNQRFEIIGDGKEHIVMPEFTWFGFRYFGIEGKAEPECVFEVHSDVPVTSEFECDNEILNYLYTTYLNTQLNNMHTGIPSDCPHIERRGYTGDGQLTAHAAMTVLGAKEFYKKWIEDISDCQDIYTGHIQYTAPYIKSGGGPGAWGSAIVEVPWQYYLHYGDPEPMLRLYPQMKKYFEYMENHSENFLVTRDKEGEWCLGDWCAPYSVIVPAAFVNNYYYVKALKNGAKIAEMLGLSEDIELFTDRIRERTAAAKAAYFNTWDHNFIGNLQAANAFAVDMGIGDGETYKHLKERYADLGEFDTGICGTDVLLRVLFEHGDADTALLLLTSEKTHSFGGLKKRGATTLWEYWPESGKGRSLNHPMFGAAAAYLFEYVLGIRQREGSAGYKDIIISPVFTDMLNRASGAQRLTEGTVTVSYEKNETKEKAAISVSVPGGIAAEFIYKDFRKTLAAGENSFEVKL